MAWRSLKISLTRGGCSLPLAASVIGMGGTALLYMIVEHFKNQDPLPVYRRFRDSGRLAPEGLQYISSWVDEKLERCFQLMEADEREQLNQWISNWSDLVEFEVYPVMSSQEAAERVSPRL